MKELIKLNFINLRLSALRKALSRRIRSQATDRKCLRIIYSIKDLFQRHRELLKVNNKKRNSPVPMWGRPKQTFLWLAVTNI